MTPIIAYKYCSPRGVDILKNLELKITPPNQFNDPFEFTPHMICSNPLQYARRMLRNKPFVKQLYSALIKEGRFFGSFRDFREKAASERPNMSVAFASVVPLGTAKAQKEHLDHISTKYGVLCMSETRESILMWGHYCDSHRGLVIGFDATSTLFRIGKGLRPVKYIRQRVIFDANWKFGSLVFQQYDDHLILSKNEDWRYEKEMRQFFKLSTLKGRKLDNGTPGYFLPLPPEAVVSVTLGARCTDVLAGEVRTALSNPNLRKVRLERASLHDSDFALTFEPVV